MADAAAKKKKKQNDQKKQKKQKKQEEACVGWSQRDFVRSAVLLWGDRGPQPLFDVISTLCTISPRALSCVGVHARASVSIAPNTKVPRALVPVCSEEVGGGLLPPGQVSVCPRVPIDTQGFLNGHYRRYLDGELAADDIDPRARAAVHILDMDFTDPDNTIAMLCLARALRACGGTQQQQQQQQRSRSSCLCRGAKWERNSRPCRCTRVIVMARTVRMRVATRRSRCSFVSTTVRCRPRPTWSRVASGRS